MQRKPWIWLFLATPCALAIWWFAFTEFRRVHRLADHPVRMTTAEAIRRAPAELLWVELGDAEFDCEHSLLIDEYRYGLALAPNIPADTALILPAYDGLCPKPGQAFSGALEPLEPGRHQRALVEHGLRAASLWELSVVRKPSDALAGAWLLVFVGACAMVLGFAGYLRRKSDRRLRARRAAPLSREELLRRLSRPPLELRRGYRFVQFVLPVVLQLFCVACGALMIWQPISEYQALRREHARWAHAATTPTVGPAAVMLERKLLVTPILADVHVTWHDAKRPADVERLKYNVLWYSGFEPPYEIRHDAEGTLTNVGLALTFQRLGANSFMFLMGLAFVLGSAYYARKVAKRQLAFRAVINSPRAMFRPLEKTEILRHKGIATGQIAYTFRAPSGEAVQQILVKPRVPVFDLDETNVLVVTAFDDPGAEPILVADDGYPFAADDREMQLPRA